MKETFAFPTFLGIGAPRSGTTWLYSLLAGHPEIYVPLYRKEIHFFDRYYDLGLSWYKNFFPPLSQNDKYKELGEITPHYLYCEQCPKRINQLSSINKFILLLRNPVDRAWSHWRFRCQVDNYSNTFEHFIETVPEALEWGFYSRGIKNYLSYFQQKQFLVLIYEHVFANLPAAQNELAIFLNVTPTLFSSQETGAKINRSYQPKFKHAYYFASKTARSLKGKLLISDRIVDFLKKMGVKKFFGENKAWEPSMNEKTRNYLKKFYENEIIEIEILLGVDLTCWK